MAKHKILSQALIGGLLVTMVALFFVQASVNLQPLSVDFDSTKVAYGYSNQTFSGIVYTDEGVTNIGAGKTVALSRNGAAAQATDETDGSGVFSFSDIEVNSGDLITFYLDDEIEDGVLVMQIAEQAYSGLDVYQDRVIIRSDTRVGTFDNFKLNSAETDDSDVSAVYDVTNSVINVAAGKELYVWSGATLYASGSIRAHDVENLGTLSMSGYLLTVSGSLVTGTGSFTTNTGVVLGGSATNEVLILGNNVARWINVGIGGSNSVIENGLVGWWKFDEGTGITASDSSSNSNNGTLNNMTSGDWVSDAPSTGYSNPYALDFDGSNDYVSIAATTDLSMHSTSFAVMAWIKTTTTGMSDNMILEHSVWDSSDTYQLATAGTNTLRFTWPDGTILDSASVTYTDDTWHHVAGVFDDSGNMKYIYFDGSLSNSGSENTNPSSGNSATYIGSRGGSSNFFDGRIDDVRIYDRLLTAEEVEQIASGNEVSLSTGSYTLGSSLSVHDSLTINTGSIINANDYNVSTHDVEVLGTVNMGNGLLTVSGSLLAGTGSFTTSSGVVLGGSMALETITMGLNSLYDLFVGFIEGSGGATGPAETPMQTAGGTCDNSVEYEQGFGMTFTPSIDGYVTQLGIRFYSNDTGDVKLWNFDTQTELASITNLAGTAGTWSYEDISSPVQLIAGTQYIIAAHEAYTLCYETTDYSGTQGSVTIDNSYCWGNDPLPSGTCGGDYHFHLDVTFTPGTLGGTTTITGSYVLGSGLDIDGDLYISTGSTLNVTSQAYPLTLSGNIINSGSLLTNTGTVTLNSLDGSTQLLYGPLHFYNLTKMVTSTSSLVIDPSYPVTVSGSVNLLGVAGGDLQIRSASTGVAAALQLDAESGAQLLRYLDVQDSNASNGAELSCLTECSDSGNNSNWVFAITAPASTTGSLVSWWRFDEGTGVVAHDGSGYGHSGQLINMESGDWVSSTPTVSFANDYSLDFDGTDEHIVVPDASRLSFGDSSSDSPMTIAGWVNMDDASNFFVTAKGSSSSREYALFFNNSDKFSLKLWDNSSSNNIAQVSSESLTANEGTWTHLSATYDGSSSTDGITLYVNGVAVSSGPTTGGSYTAMHDTSETLQIARAWSDNATYSDGKVDDLRIYTRELTANEVGDLANGEIHPFITWDGSTNTHWNVADNWSWNEVPNERSGARIVSTTNQPIVTEGTSVAGVAIESGASLDLNGQTFILSGGTVIRGMGTLRVRGSESIANASISGTGTVVYYGTGSYNGLIMGDSYHNLTIQPTTTLEQGLVAWWKFDDGSGSSAADSSGNNNTASITSASWVSSAPEKTGYDNALSFDGTDDRVDADIIIPTTDFTYASWVKFDALDDEIWLMASNGSGQNEFIFGHSTSGNLYVNLNSENRISVDADLTTGQWYHLAATRRGSAIEAYVNGGSVATGNHGTAMNFGSCDLLIGYDADSGCNGGASNFHSGDLSDLRVYNRGLSDSEIARLAEGYVVATDVKGTFTLDAALNVDGDLRILNGGLDVSGSSYQINLAGNWESLAGTGFVARSGTVYLDGTNQTISGSTVFNNLTKTGSTSMALSLDAYGVNAVSGALLLQGQISQIITLQSSEAGYQSTFYLDGDSGSQTLQYLTVKDQDATDGASMSCLVGCTDSSNNSGWNFGAGGVQVYWTDYSSGEIERSDDDGSNKEVFLSSGISSPHGIDIDIANQKVYWADQGNSAIKRANIDGSNVETVISSISPYGLAIDNVNGTIYWVNAYDCDLKRANLDGSSSTTLINGSTASCPVRSVAVDPGNSRVYIESAPPDGDCNQVWYYDLDGNNGGSLAISSDCMNGIDVDTVNGKIFWTGYSSGDIKSIDIDGSNETTVANINNYYNKGIATDPVAQKVYWTNDSGQIRRADYDGGNIETIVTGLSNPRDIALLSLDGAPPSITAFSPVDDATGFSIYDNLVITFNEDVTQTGTGFINLYKTAGDTLVESINASSGSLVSTSDTTVTINPQSILEELTSYYVTLTSNTFGDARSNFFPGFSSTTTWNFTTNAPSQTPQTLSGTVFTDQTETTRVGSGRQISVSVNGSTSLNHGFTLENGDFGIPASYGTGDTLTIFINAGDEKAATVIVASGSSMSGIHLYQNTLALRHGTGGIITGSGLEAISIANADTLFTAGSGEFHYDGDTELLIYSGTTLQPNMDVRGHDLEILGALEMSVDTLTLSGTLMSQSGSLTTVGTLTLGGSGSGEILHVSNGTILNDLHVTSDSNLIAYWKLDNNAVDSSGNNRSISLNGNATYSTTKASLDFSNTHSLSLDGTGDYANAGNSSVFQPGSNYTVSVWARSDITQDSTYDTIMSKFQSSSYNGWFLRRTPNTDNVFFATYSSNSATSNISSPNLVADTWYHHLFTVNGTSVAYYVNGALAGSDSSAAIGSTSASLVIGSNYSGGSEEWDGYIDDVRVYGSTLTSTQIATLAAGGDYGSTVNSYTLGAALDVNGNITIDGGAILDVSSGSYPITLSGNLLSSGTLLTRSGSITLDGETGGSQLIYGDIDFYNLTKVTTGTSTLLIDPTSTKNVSGSLVLKGVLGGLLKIRSTANGSAAGLLLDSDAGIQQLQYLDVKDSNATGGAQLLCTNGCNDSGNNDNWILGDVFEIYWTEQSGGRVKKANSDGTEETTLKSGLSDPRGIAIDTNNLKVYYIDTSADDIRRMNLDGSNDELVLDNGNTNQPTGLAIDNVNQKMYWMDQSDDSLWRADLDGSNNLEIHSTTNNGRAVAVDPVNERVYWEETNDEDSIFYADLDGANEGSISKTDRNTQINGIAVDGLNDKIYWTESNNSSSPYYIYRMDTNGSNEELLVTESSVPKGITLDPILGKMYWVNSNGQVRKADLDGSNIETINTGESNPRFIALYSVDVSAPNLQTFTPTDDSTGVSAFTNLVLNFDENIGEMGTGSIMVYRASDDALIKSQNAASGTYVTGINTSQITVDLIGFLEYSTEYYVQVTPNAFGDYYDHFYTGIDDKTTWSFTTGTQEPQVLSGTVFTDEGSTNIGASKTVALSINGGPVGINTAETDANGQYALPAVNLSSGNVLTVFIQNESERGVVVHKTDGGPLEDLNIYQDRLIVRNSPGVTPVDNSDLSTGEIGNANTNTTYIVEDGNLNLADDKELYIWQNTRYIPGSNIQTHDFENKGTIIMERNRLAVSGSLVTNAGIFTTASGIYLGGSQTSESLTLGTNSIQNLYVGSNNAISDLELVGHWRFDETSAGTFSDESINSNDGTGAGSGGANNTPQPSVLLPDGILFNNIRSLELDGTDDRVSVSNSTEQSGMSSGITISMWLLPDTITGERYLVNKADRDDGDTDNDAYILRMTGGYPKVELYGESAGGVVATGSQLISTSNWVHLVYLWDRPTSTFYIDGVEDSGGSYASFNEEIDLVDEDLFFGTSVINGSFGNYYHGKIDDLRIYNRALNTQEISLLGAGGSNINSGTYVLGSSLDINGTLYLEEDSVLDLGSNYNINLSGSLMNTGSLVTRQGSVALDGEAGSTQVLYGPLGFYNLSRLSTGSGMIKLDPSHAKTISGTLTLMAVEGDRMRLRSTNDGDAVNFSLYSNGSQDLRYLDVKDNDASAGQLLSCDIGCFDSDNTTNWNFIPQSTIAGIVYSDKGLTPIGANKVVTVSIDGIASTVTGATAIDGSYSISVVNHTGAVLSLYLTGTGAGSASASECSNYTTINDSTRNINYSSGGSCDSGLSTGWYRFTAPGNTMMPETAPSTYSCNTSAPGWVNGTHPDELNEQVDRTACFNWSGNSCNWSSSIKITNCGTYYVYYLPPSPVCSLAYCTTSGNPNISSDETDEKALLVTKGVGADFTSADLYQDTVIIRHNTGGRVTNVDLITVRSSENANITGLISSVSNTGVTLSSNTDLYVWSGAIFAPGGEITVGNLDVDGTLEIFTNTGTVAGYLNAISGSVLTNGLITLNGTGANTFTPGENIYRDVTFSAGISIAESLFGHWKLDDASGTTAADTSGNSFDGTISGASWTSDTPNNLPSSSYALDFDGSNDYVSLLTDSQLDSLGSTFSISIWFKSETTAGDSDARIFTRDCSDYWCLYVDQTDSSPQDLVFGYDEDSTETLSSQVTTNTWHHAVATWDGGNAKLYYNGSLQGTYTTDSFLTTSRDLLIGDNIEDSPNPGDSPFDGNIDDVRVYDDVLTSSDVLALYSGSTGSGSYSLVGDLVMSGTLAIQSGTLDVTENNYAITLEGNWINSVSTGSFVAHSGSVVFSGDDQRITGNTVFSTLQKTSDDGDTLSIATNTTVFIREQITLTGSVANTINLTSSVEGVFGALAILGGANTTINNIRVQDSNAAGGLTIRCFDNCSNSGNNINWDFGEVQTLSGSVFTNQNGSRMGNGRIVSVRVNGTGTVLKTSTNSNGEFALTPNFGTGDVLSIYLEGNSESAAIILIASGTTLSGVTLIQDRLILEHGTGGTITNSQLQIAGQTSYSNLLYSITGSIFNVDKSAELLIQPGTTYTASGRINAHDIEVLGTMNIGAHTLTLSGSFTTSTSASFSTSSGVILAGSSQVETLSMSGGSLGNVFFGNRTYVNPIDNTLLAHYRFDNDGTDETGTYDATTNNIEFSSSDKPTTNFANTHSINFSGNTDWMQPSSEIPIGSTWSVSFWVKKPFANTNTWNYYFMDNTSCERTLFLDESSNRFGTYTCSRGTYYGYDMDNETDGWHHITAVGQSTTTTIWVDGDDKGSYNNQSTANVYLIGNYYDKNQNGYVGQMDDMRFYSGVLSESEIALLAQGSEAILGGANSGYVLGADLDINGNIYVSTGSTVNVTGGHTISLSGSLTNSGVFTMTNGTLELDGEDQTLDGPLHLFNLSKTNTGAAVTLTMNPSHPLTISGALTMHGSGDSLISLRSMTDGNQVTFTLDAETGSENLTYLNVQDMSSLNGQQIDCLIASGCVNNGGNLNWNFGESLYIWDGSESTDWSNPANWFSGTVPNIGVDVVIPPTNNNPALTSAAAAKNIIIEEGAKLSLQGKDLTMNGAIEGAGTLQLYGNETITNMTYQGSGSVLYSGTGTYSGLNAGDNYYNVAFGSGTGIVRSDISTIDLVAWWKLDETTGSTVANDGSGADGTLAEGSFSTITAPVGYYNPRSYYFDGVNDYINTNIDHSWTASDSFSHTLWLRPETVSGNQGIMGKGAAAGDGNSNWEWGWVLVNNSLQFTYFTTLGLAGVQVTDTAVADEWQHFAVTFSNGNGAQLYKDGELVDTDSTVSTPFQDRSTNTLIGHSYYTAGTNYYYNGYLDDIRMYDRELSASEVNQLVNGTTSTGVYILDAALDVENTLSIGSGYTLSVSNNGYDLTVSGSLISTGTLVTSTGTVTLDGQGNPQLMYGYFNFFNLTKVATVESKLTIDPSRQRTVSGALVLRGSENGDIILRSSSENVQTKMYVDGDSGTHWLEYLDVKDQSAEGGQELYCLTSSGCLDSSNNSNWSFNYIVPARTLSGTVFTDQNGSRIGGGRTVAVSVNGSGELVSGQTNTAGEYAITVTFSTGDILSVFLDGETEKATTIAVTAGNTMSGVNLYQNRVALQHDADGTITSDDLSTAVASGDSDQLLEVSGSQVSFKQGTELLVDTNTTFAPTVEISGHDIEVLGTMNLGTNTVTLSGSIMTATGVLTHHGSAYLTDTQGTESITLGGSSYLYDIHIGNTVTTGSYILGGNTTVRNTLRITSGSTLNMTTNSYVLSISGSLLSSGSLLTGSGRVTMNGNDGQAQVVYGNIIFNNFTKLVTDTSTLIFDPSHSKVFNGLVALMGVEGGSLQLRSSNEGEAAEFTLGPNSSQTFSYLDVQDSDASNGNVAICFTSTQFCTNSGNNTNWRFTPNFNVAGVVYSDDGQTPAAGVTVGLAFNGVSSGTTVTSSTGAYQFTNMTSAYGEVVSLYTSGGLVTTVSPQVDLELDLYNGYHLIRHETGGTVLGTHLDVIANSAEADISNALSQSSTDTIFLDGYIPYITNEATLETNRDISTMTIINGGTIALETNTLAVSGSLLSSGSITGANGLIALNSTGSHTLQLGNAVQHYVYVNNGTIAHYRFDEGSGSTIYDAGVSGNDGTLNSVGGASWSITGATLDAYNPYALEFTNSGSYVSVGDAYDIKANQVRTFSFWVKRNTTDTLEVVAAKKTNSGTTNTGYMLYFDEENNGLTFSASDGQDQYTLQTDTTISADTWFHAAVVWDGSSGSLTKAYINGSESSLTTTGSMVDIGSLENDLSFTFGATSSGTYGLDAILDDFRIFDRALTEGEISNLSSGNRATGLGVYTLASDTSISSNLHIYGSTVDVSDNNYQLAVSGDFVNYGDLNTQSGTVVLNGTDQTLYGSTHFQVLTKRVSEASTLQFEANTKQTVSGSLSIGGSLYELLTINSNRTGVQGLLIQEAETAQSISYVQVRDNSGASGKTLVCTEGCIDNTNNINWQFTSVCGDAVLNTGEPCDDGNDDNTDACLNSCIRPVCGDSIISDGEECDPPGIDGCLNNCLFRTGGGGNNNNNSSSSSAEASYYRRPDPPEGCGNGVVEPSKGEECDTGTRYNGLGTCSYDCKALTCGDGVISPQIGEDCEPTPAGNDSNGNPTFEVASCGTICTAPTVTRTGTTYGGCQRMFLRPCDEVGNTDNGGGGDTGDTGDTGSETPQPICGNGVVESGEQCDSGGTCQGGQFNGSIWTDGNAAQQCADAGGTPVPANGDGCSADCRIEFCGDGIVQANGEDNQPGTSDDEQCDNGSKCSNNPNITCRTDEECGVGGSCEYNSAKDRNCLASCQVVICGDGTVEGTEQCDDNNTENGDGCNSSCRIETASAQPQCGNGVVEGSEACDDGNASNGDGCSTTCTIEPTAQCGNGIVETREQCDNGANNSNTEPNACRTNCTFARCGDGVIDAAEACDDGANNSNGMANACRTSCLIAYCGDGVIDDNEECDGGPGCSSVCRIQLQRGQCGNGRVEIGEQCDDGNGEPGDGCSRFCQFEGVRPRPINCGNNRVDDNEQCDDGNAVDGDGCSRFCVFEGVRPRPINCGNGIIDSGETCDDGNVLNFDGCSAVCEQEGLLPVSVGEIDINADVMIINPTEYAVAIEFVDNTNPCGTLTMKGEGRKANIMRATAEANNIYISEDIPVAREIYFNYTAGQLIRGEVCTYIQDLKAIVAQRTVTPQVRSPILPQQRTIAPVQRTVAPRARQLVTPTPRVAPQPRGEQSFTPMDQSGSTVTATNIPESLLAASLFQSNNKTAKGSEALLAIILPMIAAGMIVARRRRQHIAERLF